MVMSNLVECFSVEYIGSFSQLASSARGINKDPTIWLDLTGPSPTTKITAECFTAQVIRLLQCGIGIEDQVSSRGIIHFLSRRTFWENLKRKSLLTRRDSCSNDIYSKRLSGALNLFTNQSPIWPAVTYACS
jgi:hypothetical protein